MESGTFNFSKVDATEIKNEILKLNKKKLNRFMIFRLESLNKILIYLVMFCPITSTIPLCCQIFPSIYLRHLIVSTMNFLSQNQVHMYLRYLLQYLNLSYSENSLSSILVKELLTPNNEHPYNLRHLC